MTLNLERLESRDCPSSGTFNPLTGAASITITGPGPHTFSLDPGPAPGTFSVSLDGQSGVVSGLTSITVVGARNAVNVMQNNTSIPSTLIAGDRGDSIVGGSGPDVIIGGRGRDVLYDLLGSNVIDSTRGRAPDRVYTAVGSSASTKENDSLVTFFAAGRTPGAGAVSLENGVLYLAPSNAGTRFSIFNYPEFPDGSAGDSVLLAFDMGDGAGTQAAIFSGVKTIAYFGGAGDDTFANFTSIDTVAYGSAGDDVLIGGTGFNLLKGSGGDDVLIGRGTVNDLTGNGGADTLIGLGRDVFRADGMDTIYGARGDVVLGAPAVLRY